jgi:regulatory protein
MYNAEVITIRKVQKRGRYYYLLCSGGIELKFDSEVYFKYNLTPNSIFNSDRFNAIVDENSFRLCMNSAIRLLSQRMHSAYEIKTKLKQKGFSCHTINRVIDESAKINLLNDEQFTKNYVEELICRGQGKYKIINSLQKRGIPKEMIDENLQKLDDPESEEKRAQEVMNKKLKSLAYKKIEPRKLKDKLIRHLIYKGFSSDIAFKIVDKLGLF